MGKNGRPKMGSNKETPHSTSTSYLRAVRSNKCVPYIGAIGRDCEDDDSKSNDNANTECDNNPNSDGKYDDKDDTNDSKSDENSSTKCHNNHISDGKYDDNTSLALSKRKRKPVQRNNKKRKGRKMLRNTMAHLKKESNNQREINQDDMVSCVWDNKAILRSKLSTRFTALYNMAKPNWMPATNSTMGKKEMIILMFKNHRFILINIGIIILKQVMQFVNISDTDDKYLKFPSLIYGMFLAGEGKPLINDTFDTPLLKTISYKNFKGNHFNDAHKGFLLIVDQNVPTEEDILAFQTTNRARTSAAETNDLGGEKRKKLVILDVNGLLVDGQESCVDSRIKCVENNNKPIFLKPFEIL
ncbi:hypothetical protein ACFE04_018255 [Oxalis oulophora]